MRPDTEVQAFLHTSANPTTYDSCRFLAVGDRSQSSGSVAHRAQSTRRRSGGFGLRAKRVWGMVGLVTFVAVAVVASLSVGAKSLPVEAVLNAFTSFDPNDTDQLIVRQLRWPRTIVGLLVGVALGAAGALMQGVTRNPLADPGILGVNAGASFAVVVAISLTGLSSVESLVWFAFVGAAGASIIVYTLGSSGKSAATPVRLALAGAALSALLFSLTRGITLVDQSTLDTFRFWVVGSITGRDLTVAASLLPFVLLGLALAIGVSKSLNTVALGEETAASLGTNVVVTRIVAALAITLLFGASVAAAGPIGFVGLVVPHVVRFVFGADQRWLIPASALAGASFVVGCDTIGRVLSRPGEIQVGIVTALLGGPLFMILARRARMAQL